MTDLSNLEAIVRNRIRETEAQMRETISRVREGMARSAETDEDRLEAAIERNLRVPSPVARMYREDMAARIPKTTGREAIQGATIDFVPVAYLERGLQVARAVARIANADRRPKGTGFLCSNHLLVTNNHVIGSPEEAALYRAEFNYEVDLDGSERPVTTFRLAPERFFFTDGIDGLAAIAALGDVVGDAGHHQSGHACHGHKVRLGRSNGN